MLELYNMGKKQRNFGRLDMKRCGGDGDEQDAKLVVVQ